MMSCVSCFVDPTRAVRVDGVLDPWRMIPWPWRPVGMFVCVCVGEGEGGEGGGDTERQWSG